jgi:GT2 family glycosyltransferase
MSAVEVDVLIPTFDRPAALAVTLTSLFAQTLPAFRVVVSDQGEAAQALEVQALARLLAARGCDIRMHRHLPRRGLAEQRSFLLSQARAPYALFLDDDVVLEPTVLERLLRAIRDQGCGFVGAALIGMSYAGDVRPHQQRIEFWQGRVTPERIQPGGEEWARHHLHSAANLYHLQERLGLPPGEHRLYRVAWIGGCVLFDAEKLRAVGGFDFWRELPDEHCGEDVLAELRVMARFGGCGILPSGAYHLELPTTVPHREVDAPKVLSVHHDG